MSSRRTLIGLVIALIAAFGTTFVVPPDRFLPGIHGRGRSA